MKQHPTAKAITPPLRESEYLAYEESILKNGQIDDIITHEGMILDKWHMYQILEKHKIPPRLRPWHKNGVETPRDFVIAKLQGRNLKPHQLACIAAIELDATKDRMSGLREANEKRKQGIVIVKTDCKARYKKIADVFKIGGNSVAIALVLLHNAKDLFEDVRCDRLIMGHAYRLYRERKGFSPQFGKQVKSIENIKLTKEVIITPNMYESEEVVEKFAKNMTAHGWIFEMKLKDGKFYGNWYGNGFNSKEKVGSLESGHYEFKYKHAVIVAAKERLDSLKK